MEGERNLLSVNTGGSRVSKEEERLLAKLLGARKRGTKELNPDELATIREANKQLKPVGRSVSEQISVN